MIRSFNRFELKYVVPAAVRDALLADIRQQMRPDALGDEGVYQVTSLYYDTRDFHFVHAKADGIRFRRKLRVRVYGELAPDPEAPAMVEIKQRINRTVQKRRLGLPLRDAYALCDGELDLERSWEDARDAAVASEVTFLTRALDLLPSCVVGYQRVAFVGGPYEPGLRLTFDQALWCRSASALLSTAGDRYYFVPPDWTILEVKTDHAMPLWVSRMLARHDVSLHRFSKYCTAAFHLERQGLLHPRLEGKASWTS